MMTTVTPETVSGLQAECRAPLNSLGIQKAQSSPIPSLVAASVCVRRGALWSDGRVPRTRRATVLTVDKRSVDPFVVASHSGTVTTMSILPRLTRARLLARSRFIVLILSNYRTAVSLDSVLPLA